jgi:ribosomal protein S3
MIATASVALAAQPKHGLSVYGKTSYRDGYVFVDVARSDAKVSVQLPAIESIFPPKAKGLKVSATGKFSGTRTGRGSVSKHGSYADWTLKISGKFTTPTKAKGTFTAVGIVNHGGTKTTIRSGKQTFKATKQP